MNHLLQQDKEKLSSPLDTSILLLEASRRLREHGVYVVTTQSGVMPLHMKVYLENSGKLLGMEWKFDLDGISDDGMSVSVARKYFTGELPSVGRLARVSRQQHP